MVIMTIQEMIKKAIKETAEAFEKHPDIFLTEDDARCYLATRLLKNKELSLPKETSEGLFSIPVHSEVRWYGNNGRLKYRSDVVVLDVSTLRTGRYLETPSKGYAFNKFNAVIELKLRRKNGSSDNQFIKLVKADFRKLLLLQEEVQDVNRNASYYVLCLDKKNDIETDLNDGENTNINLTYVHKSI
jgi:hypothetical protein